MSEQFPNQYWDVYTPIADSEAVYQGTKLFADPDRELPEQVLRNFTLEEKGKEIVMTEAAFSTYQRVALDGYAVVPGDK
ncbi:hypothetical protein G6L13_09625 [Agrobacterium tumefaciens]|uniref:hypothetical protein n=1 Tax=Agrobacterium tumefaciens TaxID=358 RepID=UPI00157325AC|nr:hypothetical protein [Agrobacterium tumefaciens]NTA80744.1 hypothetical protein [Agrobacterium tumefaciens]